MLDNLIWAKTHRKDYDYETVHIAMYELLLAINTHTVPVSCERLLNEGWCLQLMRQHDSDSLFFEAVFCREKDYAKGRPADNKRSHKIQRTLSVSVGAS